MQDVISIKLAQIDSATVSIQTMGSSRGCYSVTLHFAIPRLSACPQARVKLSLSVITQPPAHGDCLCGLTASGTASGCGTLVFAAAALELPDFREVAYSVLVGSFAVLRSAAASVGFLTFVVDNPQRVDVAQQQAAAADGLHALEAKATPRVDVGDLPEASSFLQAMGSHETEGEESTKAEKFQVFVKNLAGKTVVVRGFSGLDEVSLVVSQVESLTGVPRSLFYMVGASGRRLQEDVTLVQSGIGPDSSLFMSARLRRGAVRSRAPLVPGSWTCSNCNMGVCWPSKNVCFRCLAPRPTHGPQYSPPRPATETQHLGRAPPAQRSGNPTVRRGSAPSPQPRPVHSGKPDTTLTLKGDGMAVLKAWRGLGISESLVEQVQASLVPERTDVGNAWEKAETKAQLHSLRVRIGRQEKSVENAQESLNRASEKLLHMRHEHDQLLAQFREMQSRLSPSSSKTPSVIGDVTPVIEEVGSTPMDEEVEAPLLRLRVRLWRSVLTGPVLPLWTCLGRIRTPPSALVSRFPLAPCWLMRSSQGNLMKRRPNG